MWYNNRNYILEDKKDVNKPNYFYYVVPTNLINVDEVPDYAGLIYINATVFGNNRIYYSFNEVKKAPKLHSKKANSENLNLVDKFYYNYIHWKHKHEKDMEDYKRLLTESKTVDDIEYSYTLPQAMNMIESYKEELKNSTFQMDSFKNMYHYEQGLRRRLMSELKKHGIDYQSIINSYENEHISEKITEILD